MKNLITFFLLFLSFALYAQEPTRCGTDEIFEEQLQDPKFKRSYLKLEKIAKEA
ncbi:hypothetical protein N8580_00110 [Akkermansiaceae bacterium]|nr:hypothetical protein [Akkermansiaceae bacterium]